jgi:hypothetical protein
MAIRLQQRFGMRFSAMAPPVIFGLVTSLAAMPTVARIHGHPRPVVQAGPLITQPVPQVVPQFNDPGPQIHIPPPGNAVEQLAPIESMRPPPSPLGIK